MEQKDCGGAEGLPGLQEKTAPDGLASASAALHSRGGSLEAWN